MKHTILADTGPLYAAVDPDDAYHHRAQDEIRKLERNKYDIVLSYSTLLESHSLVLHRLGRKTAAVWLDEILQNLTLVNPTVEDYQSGAMTLSQYHDQSITLFDASLAAMAARLKVSIWTYDHHFDVMRSKVWR
jgi:predicted nucleic acid-binding protein